MKHHRLLNVYVNHLEFFFSYSIKPFLDLSKSLFDAEIIYNLSSLDNCDILYLLRYDWSNMALIKVLHPHVILFMLLIGFIYFGMYFLSDVSPIQILPSIVLAPKKPPSEIDNIMSLCSSLPDIWSRCFYFFTRVPLNLTNTESFTLGECITWGWLSIQSCN